jgi:hypothetical protein
MEIFWHPDRLARARSFVLDTVNSGSSSQIARTFPFEQVVEAYRYMESNEQIGTVVLMVSKRVHASSLASAPQKSCEQITKCKTSLQVPLSG